VLVQAAGGLVSSSVFTFLSLIVLERFVSTEEPIFLNALKTP